SSAGSGRVDGYRCRRGASEIRVGKVPVGFQVENRGWSFWLRYDENPARGIERRTPRLGDGNRSGGPPLYAFAPQGKEEQARSAVSDHFVGTGTDERERTCVICPVRTLEVGVLERIHLKEIVGCAIPCQIQNVFSVASELHKLGTGTSFQRRRLEGKIA